MTAHIRVTFKRHDETNWRQAPDLRPGDDPGSAPALRNGEEAIIVFGWVANLPLVWWAETPGTLTDDGRGRIIWSEALGLVGHLGEGPVEMNAPDARWRWELVDDGEPPVEIEIRTNDQLLAPPGAWPDLPPGTRF